MTIDLIEKLATRATRLGINYRGAGGCQAEETTVSSGEVQWFSLRKWERGTDLMLVFKKICCYTAATQTMRTDSE